MGIHSLFEKFLDKKGKINVSKINRFYYLKVH